MFSPSTVQSGTLPVTPASRRGRVNMASEQVRYFQHLLLFLHFTVFSAQMFVNRAIIYILESPYEVNMNVLSSVVGRTIISVQ